jgi:hypothetical protein
VAQVQVLMRASDPIFELGMILGGHRQEDAFGAETLRALGARFDLSPEVQTQTVCVDKRRQWSRWTNVWQSSAIRTSGYLGKAPLRHLPRMDAERPERPTPTPATFRANAARATYLEVVDRR